MEKSYKNCQSCGMPLKEDIKGTNADGSKSFMYCTHCYQNGKFTASDITVEEMQQKVKSKLKEFGFPGFIAGFFAKRITGLERWKNKASS